MEIVYEIWDFILALVIAYAVIRCINNYLMILKERNDIKAFEINVTTPNDNEAIIALDKLIEDTLSEWVILHRGYKEKEYISNAEEEHIVKEVSNLVNDRISPILLDKLSFYYSTSGMPVVIANKTYIRVLSYVLENNKLTNKK